MQSNTVKIAGKGKIALVLLAGTVPADFANNRPWIVTVPMSSFVDTTLSRKGQTLSALTKLNMQMLSGHTP